MNTRKRAPAGLRLAIGVLLFVSGIMVFKSVRLSLDVAGDTALSFQYLLLDLSFFGLLMLGAIIQAHFRSVLLRMSGLLILLLAALFYAIHSFVLLELDEYMSLMDLGRYLPEWDVVESFLGPASLLVVLLLIVAAVVHVGIGRRGRNVLIAGSLLMLTSGVVTGFRAPADLARYALIPVSRLAETVIESQPLTTYGPGDADYFENFGPAAAQIPERRPDIILLVVESLSSINSKRTSGVHDNLPGFDRLSEKGVLFTDFLANHAASEGGIISLMSGFPPLHYPTASPLMFDEFAMQDAVVHDYQEAGYFAEFLTNADLSFIGLSRYLDGLGIDLARGRDEVEAFSSAPRITQDAPSDRFLYEEALERLDQRAADSEPWLLVMATASTHLPYRHPEGGEDSATAVWAWSMERLDKFVDGLERRHYFDNGLLLITGDHRQMRPVTDEERQRYGVTARARVPLLAIGDGLPAGEIDPRLFQQADLLRFLARIYQPGMPLSEFAIWVERYNRIYGRVESINRFRIFQRRANELVSIPVRVKGAQLEWPDGRPALARAVEAKVHYQRSHHQVTRNGDAPACKPGLAGGELEPSGGNGLSYWRIEGRRVNDLSRPPADRPTTSGIGEAGVDGQREGLDWYLGYLQVEETGTYWFRSSQGGRLCLSINGQLVLDQLGTMAMQAPVELQRGSHLIDLRLAGSRPETDVALQWIEPGLVRWRWREIPGSSFKPAVPVK